MLIIKDPRPDTLRINRILAPRPAASRPPLAALLALLLSASITSAPSAAAPASTPGEPESAATCRPLSPPSGVIVNVATVTELQDAVNTLASNTTILIADGVYDIDNTLVVGGGISGAAIRGGSGDRDTVVIRGRGMSNPNFGNVPHGFLIQDAADLLIADLTVRDAYYHNVQVQGERGASGLRLYNVHLIDSGEQQIKGSTAGPPGPYADNGMVECCLIEYADRARSWYTNGVDILAGADWTVRDNVFRNIRAPVGELAGPAILMWRNCLNTTVERNLLVDCDRGIALGLSAPDANSRDGETVYDHQGGVIRNNMIYRSPGSTTGDVGITVNYARDFRIYHNTVVLNATFFWTIEYRFAASSGTVAYNLTDGDILNRNGAAGSEIGNLTGALPGWFVDAAAADLHLLDTALPAIDQAAPLADVPDDFDLDPRPNGALPDIGADELACVVPAEPVRVLLLEKTGDDANMRWTPLAGVHRYNVWYVADPAEIDLARLASAPPAMGVDRCSPPFPATAASCTDGGAISRGAPSSFYYQVRSFCGGSAEGP